MTTDIRVLIVDDDPIFRLDLRDMLPATGCLVAGEAGNAQRALELARKLSPDLVIMDVRLPGEMDGIAAAATLIAERTCAVLLLSGFSDVDLAQRAAAAGATGYLLKPIDAEMLRPAIHIALSQYHQVQALRQELLELREELQTRQIVEQAADLLMREHNLSEQEALNRIHTAGMNAQKSDRAIAEAIILAQQISAG